MDMSTESSLLSMRVPQAAESGYPEELPANFERRRLDALLGRAPRVLVVIENTSFTYDTRMQKICRSLLEAGCAVEVVCPRFPGDPSKRHDDYLSVNYYPAPPEVGGVIGHLLEYAWSSLFIAGLVIKKLASRSVDVVHLCSPPDIYYPHILACRAVGVRTLVDVHDLSPELGEVQYPGKPLVAWLIRVAEKLTLRAATHVVATSGTAVTRLMHRVSLEPPDISLVRNGPDWRPDQHIERSPPERPWIEVGYVGTMNAQDGVENLLLAADYLVNSLNRKDLRFVCIGDGAEFSRLKDMAARLGLNDKVEFTGRLPPDRVMERLANCDLCVQPDPKNAFTDACIMVKSLEYMTLGKAFVAFDLEETRQLCGDAVLIAGGNGPVDLAEGIVNLADDPLLRTQMGAAGRRRIETELGWPHAASGLLDVYAQLLTNGRGH